MGMPGPPSSSPCGVSPIWAVAVSWWPSPFGEQASSDLFLSSGFLLYFLLGWCWCWRVAVTVTMVLVTVVVEMARMVMTVVLMGVVMGAVVKMAAVGGWLRAHPWNLMAWIQIPAVPLLIG